MKKIILISVCLVIILKNSFACINEYRTLLSGKVVYIDPSSGKIWNKLVDTLELQKKSNMLLAAYERTDSLEYYSDYAAALTYLQDYQNAKNIYEEIERLSPNLYTTASNLGTIYELIGKPDSALIWIKKSIEINPESHNGSEWIHIKILEHKLSEKSNFKGSILQLDFGNGKLPLNSKKYDLEKLKIHIWHQLQERTTFVKPKNKIVGNIYFDLGNILAQIRDVQTALESYEAAIEYGFESDLMNLRIKELNRLAAKAESSQLKEGLEDFLKSNVKILFLLLGLVAFTGILILSFRITKRRKTKG